MVKPVDQEHMKQICWTLSCVFFLFKISSADIQVRVLFQTCLGVFEIFPRSDT